MYTLYISFIFNVDENNFDYYRELKAEVLRLRGYEKQLGAPPRRLLADPEASTNDKSDEVERKQREIDELRDQLKRTEEQLAVTQKYIFVLVFFFFNNSLTFQRSVRRRRSGRLCVRLYSPFDSIKA